MNNEELLREYIKGWYAVADRYRAMAADYSRQADEVERQAVELEKRLETPSKVHGEPTGQWMEPPAGWKPIAKTPPGSGQLAPEFPNPFKLVCPNCQRDMLTTIGGGVRRFRCEGCGNVY